jgi:TPR repeat protein
VDGDGVERDYAAAMLWARRAADQGNAVGEHNVGALFNNGWGVPKDLRAAASWWARAAGHGSEVAKVALRDLATDGVSEATAALHRLVEDAPLRAADAAVVAAGRCPLGDYAAQMAAIARWGARPLSDLRAAAEAGDLAAMAELGERFFFGLRGSPPKDHAQALIWFRRAAAANMAGAQCQLGVMHARGEGSLAVDDKTAARLWRHAADQGDPVAQGNLAFAYTHGAGVAKDYAAALLWARRSAEAGNAGGEFHLGVLYVQGWDVPRDVREGIKWLAKAAAQGLESAIEVLRQLAADGVADAAAALRSLRLRVAPT